ncbi:hypothetical protein [Virgibacillus kimchii]
MNYSLVDFNLCNNEPGGDKLKMVSKTQEKYRKSNKLILGLKALFSVLTIYFAGRVIFITISGLMGSGPAPAVSGNLFFGMMFFLGLSNVVYLVEMYVNGKKKHFRLLLITTSFLLIGSAYMLLA